MFGHFPATGGDPILSLQEVYSRDERPDKVNLSIGLYYDDAGLVPELASVSEARERVLAHYTARKYQPMAGAANFRQAVQALLFGDDNAVIASGNVATIQTIGGSGALKVGADLLKLHFPSSEVWISDPTWDNHIAIFEGAGFEVKRYPYLDRVTRGVNFASMVACLNSLPPRSVVLLHACCHNPTGADLAEAEWDKVVEIIRDRKLIPFFDIAYQGYGEGVEADRYVLRRLADEQLSFLVSNSFSKTFSLYGERCGALSIVCKDAEEASRVLGQAERMVRRNYSSPPTFGGQIVATVLLNPELNALWIQEVSEMRARIFEMRSALREGLSTIRPDLNFAYLLQQRGMFSYTGLSPMAVTELRERAGIYLVETGRLCLTGLNRGNIKRVTLEIASVLPD